MNSLPKQFVVCYRRWRYINRIGLQLVITREYKRVMKLLDINKLISFTHKLVKRGYYDGAAYDEIHIKLGD